MVTNTENQPVELKEKIETFFWMVKPYMRTDFCPTKDLMSAATDKWSIFILFNLGYTDTMRFNHLKSKIRGISARMLTVTLKKLEKIGLVERKVYAEVPPRVEYRLTSMGQALSERLVDLNTWFFDAYKESLVSKGEALPPVE